MKKEIAAVLAVLLLLFSGCSGAKLPAAEPVAYDPNTFPHSAPENGERVNVFSEESLPVTEKAEVSPERFMEAVSYMTEDDYATAAELLDEMGSYRNADHLADICHGILEQDFDRAVTAMQWVDALCTFTYDDEYAYRNYHLTSYFSDVFDAHKHDETVDGLNAMLEATYYEGLAEYDSAYSLRDELTVDDPMREDALLTFRNITVSGWIKEEVLEACKGKGTGKILIAEKGAGSGDSFKLMPSNMIYALPSERVPKSLDEVEYVLFIDDDYDTMGVYTNGAVAIKYKITFTVKQFPGGDVIYDSGLLIGDDPDETVYTTGPVAAVPGKLPDMTDALAAIEEILGLTYAD